MSSLLNDVNLERMKEKRIVEDNVDKDTVDRQKCTLNLCANGIDDRLSSISAKWNRLMMYVYVGDCRLQ